MRITIDHQNIFFTSDLHVFHANVIRFDNRPFDNVEQMNQTLINNWNSVVTDKDVVFYLGDLSFNRHLDDNKLLVNQLNGQIHFILGNHDNEKDIRKLNRFETISDYINLSVVDLETPRKKQGIMMMHYPILSWDKAHHGDFHLHGHCHGSLTKDPNYEWYYKRRVLDIGCNLHNYTPLSYSEIKKIMLLKEVSVVEHH